MRLINTLAGGFCLHVFVFLLSISCFFNGSAAAQEVLPSTALAPALELASVTDRADLRNFDTELKRKHYPIFVFVPGVLGSRLFKDESGREEIWGRVEAQLTPRDLLYDPSQPKAKVEILDKIDARYFTTQIYGNALTYIRDRQLSDVVTLKVFPYDWRQDNTISAQELNTFLCDPANELSGRKIIFLAHSMGGLIVKKWMKEHYPNRTCGQLSGKLNVQKIVFLGTPHMGAPKSIGAFADGFRLATNSRSLFGRIFGHVDKHTLAEALNIYGASFPSAYQLLPIYDSRKCGASLTGRALPFSITYHDEAPTTDIELFDVTTWKRFGWPKTMPPGWDRDAFYRDKLPGFLDMAREFLCEVAYYDLERTYPTIETIYFVGANTAPDTEAGYTIMAEKDRYGNVDLHFSVNSNGGYVNGDGTVPLSIAANMWKSDKIRRTSTSHQDLLSADEVKFFATSVFSNARYSYEEEIFRSQYRKSYIDHYVDKRIVALLPRYNAAGDPDNIRTIVDANKEIIAKLGLSTSDIFETARSIEAEDQKADLMAIAAGTGALDPLELAWSFDTLAALEAKNGNAVGAAAYGARTTIVAWTLTDTAQKQALLNSASRYQWQAYPGYTPGLSDFIAQTPQWSPGAPMVWRPAPQGGIDKWILVPDGPPNDG